jgi:polyisoprenoid-binding protein YceI
MPMLKKTLVALALGGALIGAGQAMAADYAIDKQGQHAFVNFKISHLGYSWLYGTFKDFDGSFSFDAAKPQDSKVNVTLNTTSVDTNHAERDKHIRSDDFLNVSEHPTATFASTSVKSTGEGTADITGDLTLNGVTKPVVIAAKFIGEGKDPWGGYRAGFEGSTTLKLKDFDISKDLGPASESVELIISVEGVRK